MKLSELQQTFQAYLLDEPSLIAENISKPKRGGAEQRLDVYGGGYLQRLVDVLASDFPAVRFYLGGAMFTEIAQAYLAAYPSRYYTVRYVGQHFSDYLQQTELDKPYLSELAALEWAFSNTLDAPDAPLVTKADLAQIAPEAWGDIQISFQAHVQHLDCYYNSIELWQGYQQGKKITSQANLHFITLWRQQMMPYYHINSPAETCMTQAVLAQKTFGEICEQLQSIVPEAEIAQCAVNTLVTWLDTERVSQLTLKR